MLIVEKEVGDRLRCRCGRCSSPTLQAVFSTLVSLKLFEKLSGGILVTVRMQEALSVRR